MNLDPVVITAAARTPIGAFQGVFKDVPATALGVSAMQAVLTQGGGAAADIDEVFFGHVVVAGLGQVPVRQAALRAGLAPEVPCTAISKVCGSSLQAVMLVHDLLRAGTVSTALVGGMENMSRAPMLLGRERGAHLAGLLDHLMFDVMQDACTGATPIGLSHFVDATAAELCLTRALQEAQALSSFERARAAQDSGAFERETVPVTLADGRVVERDEPVQNVLPAKFAELKPLSGPGGTATAATASPLSDGAAALVMTVQSRARERGWPVRALVRGHASHAQAPAQFSTAPVGAVRKLLDKTGWPIDTVELWEIGEGFTVGLLAVCRALGVPLARVNVHGGACALGHPVGATGARMLVTLLHAMERRGARRGIATLCMGGGEALAVALEMPS